MTAITASPQEDALHPVEILLNTIAALMARMFASASGGDLTRARLAAREAINAYGARGQEELLPIAEIIGFSLASIGSISVSMTDGLPLPMMLRLRGNANACHRCCESSRQTLREGRRDLPGAPDPHIPSVRYDGIDEAALIARVTEVRRRGAEAQAKAVAEARLSADTQPGRVAQPAAQAPVHSEPAAQDPVPAEPAAQEQVPAEPAAQEAAPVQPAAPQEPAGRLDFTQQQRKAIWGAAAARIAQEYLADLPNLPPAERKAATIRASMLSTCANDLLTGAAVPSPLRPGALDHIIRRPGA